MPSIILAAAIIGHIEIGGTCHPIGRAHALWQEMQFEPHHVTWLSEEDTDWVIVGQDGHQRSWMFWRVAQLGEVICGRLVSGSQISGKPL